MASASPRGAMTTPCRYGKHHNHALLLSQNWVVENPVETHFRRGRARRSDGRSNSRSICVRSASRIRRYCSSRSEGDACLGGGSSIDQKRCRPAPGTMGQVSARPLQRMTPSSQERPNEGSVVCAEMSNGMPSSPSA